MSSFHFLSLSLGNDSNPYKKKHAPESFLRHFTLVHHLADSLISKSKSFIPSRPSQPHTTLPAPSLPLRGLVILKTQSIYSILS